MFLQTAILNKWKSDFCNWNLQWYDTNNATGFTCNWTPVSVLHVKSTNIHILCLVFTEEVWFSYHFIRDINPWLVHKMQTFSMQISGNMPEKWVFWFHMYNRTPFLVSCYTWNKKLISVIYLPAFLEKSRVSFLNKTYL